MSSRPSSLVGVIVAALVVVAATGTEAHAQASIVPVSRILRAQATVPPVSHTPPNLIRDPDAGGPLSHFASVFVKQQPGNQRASATVTTDIQPASMEFSVFLSASAGQTQASANAGATARINLTSDSVFRVRSQWELGKFHNITVRNGLNSVVFAQNQSGPPEVTLSLPADTYMIGFNASIVAPGGAFGGYTFTQIPEPAGAAALLLAPAAIVSRRQRADRRSRSD